MLPTHLQVGVEEAAVAAVVRLPALQRGAGVGDAHAVQVPQRPAVVEGTAIAYLVRYEL